MSSPTRPRTGPGRNTEVIIDRPELQARRHRWTYSTLTLVAWVIWMYLWLPVVTIVAWYLGVRTFIREIMLPDRAVVLALVLSYLAVIVVMGVILVVWSQYNLRRFRGLERRRASPPVTDQEILEWFQCSSENMERLRVEKSVTVEYDEEGGILAVEPGPNAQPPSATN